MKILSAQVEEAYARLGGIGNQDARLLRGLWEELKEAAEGDAMKAQLRDEFAKAAMPVASEVVLGDMKYRGISGEHLKKIGSSFAEMVSEGAYEIADAMLAAREQPTKL